MDVFCKNYMHWIMYIYKIYVNINVCIYIYVYMYKYIMKNNVLFLKHIYILLHR